MTDISSMIQELLVRFGSIDIAESEFKRLIFEDEALKAYFKEWCDEYLDNHESAFDSLTEYDE